MFSWFFGPVLALADVSASVSVADILSDSRALDLLHVLEGRISLWWILASSFFFIHLLFGVGLWASVLLVVDIGRGISCIAVGVHACFLSSWVASWSIFLSERLLSVDVGAFPRRGFLSAALLLRAWIICLDRYRSCCNTGMLCLVCFPKAVFLM